MPLSDSGASEAESEQAHLVPKGRAGSETSSHATWLQDILRTAAGPSSDLPIEPKGPIADLLDAPLAFARWLSTLGEVYGCQLLVLLFASQHMLKGFAQSLNGPSRRYVFQEYNVPGPRMEIFSGVVGLPWALKPIIGMVSDLVPLFGYNKGPYMLIATFIGLLGLVVVGFSTTGMAVELVVLAMFFIELHVSVCDLLTEAKYAEQLTEKPEYGPDLMTYVWSGINSGGLVATLLVGWLIANFGARMTYIVAILPAAFIIWPTLKNYLKEKCVTEEELAVKRAQLFEQKEAFILCIIMLCSSVFLAFVGMFFEEELSHFIAALIVTLVVLLSFSVLLNPIIAKVNAFMLIQSSFSVAIGGATFYFYTDNDTQFPEGPHFSTEFFTTVLGLVGSACSLIGLALYNKYMKNWRYRQLMMVSNIAGSVLALGDILLFTRYNLKLGIPDHAFVLGSSVAMTIIGQWQWMPGIVLMSQLCPAGMEATMYALLAGCYNLGNTLSDYLGAYMLDRLGVKPAGLEGESAMFDNLWKASCISTVLPLVTLVLIPFLIPDAQQTDKLLEDDDRHATSGSLWQRWMGRDARHMELNGERI